MGSYVSKISLSCRCDPLDRTSFGHFFGDKFLHIRPHIGVLVFLWDFLNL
jgi:hypothetical protein